MPKIVDLTASSPILAPARAPSPTPSLEWIKTELRNDNEEFLDINELIKEEKLSPAPTVAPTVALTAALSCYCRSLSTLSSNSSSSLLLSNRLDKELNVLDKTKSVGKGEPALDKLSIRYWTDVDVAVKEISITIIEIGFGIIKIRASNYRYGEPA